MSLNAVSVNITRPTVTEDDGGGETTVYNTVYSGLSVTIGYPDKSAVERYETSGSRDFGTLGPGSLTRSDRVVFLDPWDGSVDIRVADRVVLVTPQTAMPAFMDVVAVRPYEDGPNGELQLDVDDVS